MSPGHGSGPDTPRVEATCTTPDSRTRQGNGSSADCSAAPSTVDLGSHAIACARAGLEVFPLNPGGKTTLAKLAPHSHLDATSDVDQVRDWWV